MPLFSRGALLLAAILISRFLGFAARQGIVPFFPELMARYGIAYTQVGALVSAYLGGFAAALFPSGLLADRWDGRRLVALGLLLQAASLPAVVLAPHWTVAAGARALLGVSAALQFGPMFKLVVLYLPQPMMGLVMSAQEVFIALGILFGLSGAPLLSAWLPYTTQHLILAAASTVAAAGCLLLPLPPRQPERRRPGQPSRRPRLDGRLVPVALVWATTNVLIAGYMGWAPAFVQDGLGWGRSGAALASLILLCTHGTLALVFGRLTDRLHRRSLLVLAGTGIMALACLTLALAGGRPAVLVAMLLLGAGTPLTVVPLLAIFSAVAGPERAGAAFGLVNAAAQVAGALAGSLAGWLVDATGSFRPVWWFYAAVAAAQLPLILPLREQPDEPREARRRPEAVEPPGAPARRAASRP